MTEYTYVLNQFWGTYRFRQVYVFCGLASIHPWRASGGGGGGGSGGGHFRVIQHFFQTGFFVLQ